MEDIRLVNFTEWLYDRYGGKLSCGYEAEDCFILADMADVLIMIEETNNGRLDDLFGLPMKKEVKCGMVTDIVMSISSTAGMYTIEDKRNFPPI